MLTFLRCYKRMLPGKEIPGTFPTKITAVRVEYNRGRIAYIVPRDAPEGFSDIEALNESDFEKYYSLTYEKAN